MIIYLNEVYFGKKPISHLQTELSTIRKKFKGKYFMPSMNIDPDVLQFNRHIEDFFGYSTFSLNISPNPDLNAYAMPVGAFLSEEQKKNITKVLKANKNGFRHDPKNGAISAVCTLNIGTINSDVLTDEEIFAILLHEIGHTFFEAVTNKDCIYTINTKLIAIIKNINFKIIDILSHGEDTVDDNKVKNTVDNIINDVKFTTKKVLDFIKPHSIFNNIKNIFVKESMNDNMKPSRIHYTNEKYADSFATAYGYGPELHSGLVKMFNDGYDKIKNNPKMKIYSLNRYLFNDLKAYILDKMDPHPRYLARIKVDIDYLKRELAKETMDPKMKKMILAEINAMQSILDDFVNMPNDGSRAFVIRQFYIELYKKFGGDRREQDTDNEALWKTIDDRYNNLKKEN